MPCGFKAGFIHCHIMNVWKCLSSGIRAGSLMSCIFKGILINWRGSCHSSAAIKVNRTVINCWSTAWRETRGEGENKEEEVAFRGELPVCSICIIIELLFRILISAHYWFFYHPPPPQQLNQLEWTIILFFQPCHLLSSSSFSVLQSQLYTLLLIGQSLPFCEFNTS